HRPARRLTRVKHANKSRSFRIPCATVATGSQRAARIGGIAGKVVILAAEKVKVGKPRASATGVGWWVVGWVERSEAHAVGECRDPRGPRCARPTLRAPTHPTALA